jgi:hypothetical protein
MCNLYSITTNQAAIIALFRVMNRYVGNLPPMPGVFPDYPGPCGAQRGHRVRDGDDAPGHAAATTGRWKPGDEYQEHVVTALAGLAQARDPVLGAVQWLRRICAGAKPGDQGDP